ncbi:flavodoxin [Treponema brennaborense]|uniref:Flavodoxin n=1 Tax=Treponema brennaborense (strain DSM 12168 / CIP 105900 / DD5/3) TaxID=906968 RepID=F4LLI4_TREBD|nr:flavodoxin [Treponema brennaborense]AEE16648.1 flavodoxin [Treponema brennaborense DSM 12168]
MKAVIVYASTTGNTEQMAQAIAEGVKAAGAEAVVSSAEKASEADALAADVLLLGSPAMGAEVLDDPMEAFFSSIENSLSGKKVGLFGSYDWGDGQWMRDWEERVKAAGAQLLNGAGLTVHLTPESADKESCTAFGTKAVRDK